MSATEMKMKVKVAEEVEVAREHLGLVVVGHVDAGKSTTTGRLIYELGGLSDREMAKLKKIAVENNRAGFEWAYVFDASAEERERGITINTSTKHFFTANYHYSVIDAPGHRDFIKNMISGASQADAALLMVPADKGGFEASIARGNHKQQEVEGQTRQHARLLSLYGIDRLIVCVNKMDDKLVNYSEQRFQEIKEEVYEMLKKIFGEQKVKTFPFIPISGFCGDNLVEKSSNMKWFKGWKVASKPDKNKQKGGKMKASVEMEGHTLLDALDFAIKPPKRSSLNKKALRMPVSSLLKITGIGDVITGRIEQGQLKRGDVVRFYPSNCGGKVLSIEMHQQSVQSAQTGDNVGINLRAFNSSQKPRVGDVMCLDVDGQRCAKQVKRFTAMVYVQQHPGKLKIGFTPLIHIRTAKVPAKLIEIKWKRNANANMDTGKIENAAFIEKNDEAEVVLEAQRPFVCEPYSACKPLARFAGMDQNNLVLLGKVIEIDNINRNDQDNK